MWLTFRAYGNYENRGKARTRYMQEICGGAENYVKAYQKKLEEVLASGEDLKICVKTEPVMKKGDGVRISGARILPQKQSEALYTVIWHPIGGQPNVEELCALSDVIRNMEDVEIRLAPDETAYIINLTGTEVEKVLKATPDSAETVLRQVSAVLVRPSVRWVCVIPRHYCMRAWKLFVKQRFRMVRCRRYTFPAVRLPVVHIRLV